jgi:uncharacterized protein (DUF3820 family)
MSRGRRLENPQGAEPRTKTLIAQHSRLTNQSIDRANASFDKSNGIEPTVLDRPDKPFDRLMPFGKHQGSKLRDVPIGYLEWMVRQPRTPNELVGLIEPIILAHYQRRASLPAPVPRDPGTEHVRSQNRKPRMPRQPRR